MTVRIWLCGFLIYLLLFFEPPETKAGSNHILLATTTSIQDSGLLDILIPIFEKKTGYFVKTIAVGSGQAIAMGERGEVDILLVHSPAEEKRLIAGGYGINRRRVMHNDFVIVGAPEDPANIKGVRLATEAFRKIASVRALFLSRSDRSGTHIKETEIWKSIGINPEGEKWYHETGLGMGQTLNVAAEKKGYTLSDRGTYLALKKKLNLSILVEGDPFLLNIYHIIEVNPAKCPKVNAAGARAFSQFMVSMEVQKLIRTYGVDQFSSPLFFPDAGEEGEELRR